jgi:antitoxin (DNA-binding transcriptional repressor) of toxin-antitoxin stability system
MDPTTVNVHEATTHRSRLFERVERGKRIVFARSGRPIAVLSGLDAHAPQPEFDEP